MCAFVGTESLKRALEVCIVYGSCDGGARGDAVGWGTALQVGRSRFRFPMMSLDFFLLT